MDLFNRKVSDREKRTFIDSLGVSDKFVLESFECAMAEGLNEAAEFLYYSTPITEQFSFMADVSNSFLKEGRVLELDLPILDAKNKTYDELLVKIFGDDFYRFRKRVGLGIIKFGSRFLNNLLMFSDLVCVKRNIDSILSLDHSKAIPKKVYYGLGSDCLKVTIGHLSLQRQFRVLTNGNVNQVSDINRLFKVIRKQYFYDYKGKVQRGVGKKVKSLGEVHNRLTLLSYSLEYKNLDLNLNQSVEKLEGKEVYEYIIQVPKTPRAIIETGRIMRHCLGSYVQSIVEGDLQVINLLQHGKPFYTLSFRANGAGFLTIREFKGLKNSNEMEMGEGEKYRQRIQFLLLRENL